MQADTLGGGVAPPPPWHWRSVALAFVLLAGG